MTMNNYTGLSAIKFIIKTIFKDLILNRNHNNYSLTIETNDFKADFRPFAVCNGSQRLHVLTP